MEREIQLTDVLTSGGESLEVLSRASPLLVVFLRHKGCAFCRETLAQLQRRRGEIEAAGVKIVLVHMIEDDNTAEVFFARWRMHDVPRVSDPRQEIYKRFGLKRGSLSQVIGWGVWWPGLKSVLRGHFPGVPRGDIFQLPGAFLVHQGRVVREFAAKNSAEHPEYTEFAKGG